MFLDCDLGLNFPFSEWVFKLDLDVYGSSDGLE
jgi:hypothetical protein